MINDNLEQQAKAIYDYWFTQFDFPNDNNKPYHSSGGKMKWNKQLNAEIPANWTVKTLDKVMEFLSGYSFYSQSYCNNGKYRLLTIKNVQDYGINLKVDNYINELPKNLPDYCLLQPYDILMSLTGNVGRIGIMYLPNCLLNQRVALVKPRNKDLHSYVYFLLKSNFLRKSMETIAGGSSQKNLSPIETGKLSIAFNFDVAQRYSIICNKYLNIIVSNLIENYELEALRDWLLPMLMNGQVTISD